MRYVIKFVKFETALNALCFNMPAIKMKNLPQIFFYSLIRVNKEFEFNTKFRLLRSVEFYFWNTCESLICFGIFQTAPCLDFFSRNTETERPSPTYTHLIPLWLLRYVPCLLLSPALCIGTSAQILILIIDGRSVLRRRTFSPEKVPIASAKVKMLRMPLFNIRFIYYIYKFYKRVLPDNF